MKAGTKKAKEAERAQETANEIAAATAEAMFVSNLLYLLNYLKANPAEQVVTEGRTHGAIF
jgi:hypothetical protein